MPDNQPSKEELDRIIRIWNQKHPKYKGMLEAQPYELSEDSDWYWSQTERQYIDKNDNKVPWTVIGGLVVALMVGNKLSAPTYGGLSTYSQLAEGLKSGALSVADWKAGMQSLVTMGQQTGILVSNGGVEFMTNSDWSYVNSQIEKQFKFLDGFAKDITDNPEKWMNGRLDNRMRLYQESAYSAYQNGLRREATLGGMDEERRVLGVADHCFIEGTRISIPGGDDKQIEFFNVGDEVLTNDGAHKVISIFKHITYETIYRVRSNGCQVFVTGNHPFLTNKGFVEIQKFTKNTRACTFIGKKIVAQKTEVIKMWQYATEVYNLEVENKHEYIANGFVVHNCNGCLEQAGLGWQPIGTLDEIGAEECGNNCRCEYEYRNSKDQTE